MVKLFGAKAPKPLPQNKFQPAYEAAYTAAATLAFDEGTLSMANPAQAVTPVKPSANALANLSEFETMPSGLENVTAKDLLIPRLTILQGLSPQVTKNKPEYNPEAKVGDFCDTGTGDLFPEGFLFVPCFYAKVYLEWAPRSANKGIIANHGTNDAILKQTKEDDKGRALLPNGNLVAETATFYGINISASNRRSFIPLSSTALKAARRWLTLITSEKLKRIDGSEFTPPLYYRAWQTSCVNMSNAEGSWNGWKFDAGPTILDLDPTKSLLKEAQEFYAQARDGLVKGDIESMAADTDQSSEKPM